MKWFYLAPLIALLVSVNSICGKMYSLYSTTLFFNIQSFLFLVDLVFWYLFFSNILNNRNDSIKLNILLSISLSVAAYLLFFSNVDKKNLNIVALSAIFKTIFCILFYYKLIKNLFYQKILLEPAFWIVTGLIFYSSLSLTFYGLNGYIKLQFSPSIASNIFSISNMLIIIMHLFFIKAYLCTIQARRG